MSCPYPTNESETEKSESHRLGLLWRPQAEVPLPSSASLRHNSGLLQQHSLLANVTALSSTDGLPISNGLLQSTPASSSASPSPSQPTSPSLLPLASFTSILPTVSTPILPSGKASSWSLKTLLPPAAALQLLTNAAQALKQHFWPLLFVYMLKDGFAFLLHRLSQRATNAVADVLLGTNLSQATNPWWLYLDPAFLENNIGYQACIVIFFLLALPLNILVSAAAATAAAQLVGSGPAPALASAAALMQQEAPSTSAPAIQTRETTVKTAGDDLVALAQQAQLAQHADSPSTSSTSSTTSNTSEPGTAESTADTALAAGTAGTAGSSGPDGAAQDGKPASAPSPGLLASLRQAVGIVHGLAPGIWGVLRRVWWVDVLFNTRALPLQALSLLVVPLPWTAPRLLAVQLAVPAAILEGLTGQAALKRSELLMRSSSELMAAYGWPFVALILMVRLLDSARNLALVLVPPRWWQDVVEVPLAVTAAFAFAKLLIIRMQDLLPLVAYLMASHPRRTPKGAGRVVT